jgi:hypothetical protein
LLCCLLAAACSAGGVVAATSSTGKPALAASSTGKPSSATSSRRRSHSAPPGANRSSCQQRFGSFSTGHWPPACWRPYGSSSPFNTPIPANPRLSSESTAIIRYMTSHHWFLQTDGSHNFTLDSGGSRPVYWSQSSDPLIRVVCSGGYPCQPGLKLHIPSGAQPENQSDGHMTVVDQAAGREYDFWRASTPAHGRMSVSSAGSIPIGANSGTGLGGVAEAADLGLLGGLVRAPELAAGRIEHALITTVPCVQSRDVWPSPAGARGDTVCANGGAAPHFASLLQLDMSDAEIAATHAPSWQQTLMTAMAHYGIYVIDTSGSGNPEMSLLSEDDQSFTSFGYPGEMSSLVHRISGGSQVAGVPIELSKFRVINPCVPRRGC